LPDFIIVIPCFREEELLPLFFSDLWPALTRAGLACSILVVDDGSGKPYAEKISKVVNNKRIKFPILLEPLLLNPNMGKGGAVYAGWKNAPDAPWLAFMDADGATPAREVVRLFQHVLANEDNNDAFIASRVKMLGRTIHRSPRRHIMGRIFATLAVVFTGLEMYDSQCGCKVVRREAFQHVEPYLREFRFAFDIDLLLHLAWQGYRIEEFPVDWFDKPGSKVNLFRDTILMFITLLRLMKKKRERGD